ncbi:MAG: sialate O-acetylesterase [Bacteroidetes bacterium]|nr:sialate O-acetylesterase [Bacteroidota bacterium]
MRRTVLAIFILLSSITFSKAQLKAARIFGDHMVLQRNQPVPVWGTSIAKAKITVRFNGQQVNTRADAQGNWKVALQPMKEGGPYAMTITSGKQKLSYTDIMLGEVWLCSGQSNMEFVLSNALGYKAELKNADKEPIRQFLVPRKMSLAPDKDLDGGQWLKADTNTIGNFTAVGYYFAKKLAQQLHVTIGLIHSSWGGTQAECWISRDAMLTDPNLAPEVKRVPSTWGGVKLLVDSVIKGYAYKNGPMMYFKANELANEPVSYFGNWQKGGIGAWEWQGRWASYRGSVFMQRTVKLDSAYARKASQLQLGQTDADMLLYINGKPVMAGNTQNNFIAKLPAGIWKGGDNSIVLELLSQQKNPSWFGVGIYGQGNTVYAAFPDTTINLSDNNWRMMPDLSKPYHFDFSPNNTMATLYNGMIAPFVPYAIAGVIWYQGEANAGNAYEYRTTFPLLINDWRGKWNRQLPFYFVQLSSWGTTPNSNQGSDWAELREAQAMTLKLPATGMAVTTDIGDANNIHPRDKADVGYRLAYEALSGVYNMPNKNKSPLFNSVEFKDGYAVVSLTHADSGLMVKDPYGYIKGFELAGADHKFYFAKADIAGSQVKVWCNQVPRPVAVRYAWTNAPTEANLFNKQGYPVGPFRSDNWRGVTEKR